MLICKLTISYDRGLARNDDKMLALEGVRVAPKGFTTADGKVVRGHGTHFKSAQDAQIVGERDAEARRIYKAFRERFLTTPIDGLYAVPAKGVAKTFLNELAPQLGLKVRVTEFEITTNGDMDAAEIVEWSNRIKRQLSSVSLGRAKEADENGLSALETLAGCPVLSKDTAKAIKALVAGVRAQTLDRVELKRGLDTLNVQIEMGQLKPRSTPKLVEAA